MDLDDFSSQLTGRYQALRIYQAIASLSADKFTTGEVIRLSGAIGADCSKELTRLTAMQLVKPVTRRGEYQRLHSRFWEAMAMIADDYPSPGR